MVKVTVYLHESNIERIHITGHADSVKDIAQYDMVCAEISAVSVGILNSIDEICGECCDITMEEGNIDIVVNENSSTLQIILKTLKIQLETIEYSNKKYIKIRKAEV